jgi:hypothetical protein
MNLPDWAERVLDNRKPLPPTFPKGQGPDAERLKKWNIFNARFRSRWSELETDKWKIPEHSDPENHIRTHILACAVKCAWELGNDRRPLQVIEAVKELDSLNEKICDTAELLAGLLRRRDILTEDFSLSENDYSELDPIDLWDALELALKVPDLVDWACVAKDDLHRFLRVAREQSRPGPEWPELLEQLSDRDYRRSLPCDAPDVAVFASGTNKSDYSPWSLRLISMLDDRNRYYGGSVLKHLTNEQLANLASVAFGAGDDAKINGEQMRKLKVSYRRRICQPDD